MELFWNKTILEQYLKSKRKTMTNPFVDRIRCARTDKGETVSGRMIETSSQKTSEKRKEMLEVEVNTDQVKNDNQKVHGLEGRGRRLASESTPVEQDHDFATSTGTLDREEMSELSDISTEIVATRRSPTDHTMMAGGTEKQTTVLIDLRKNEEHIRKHLSIHHGSGHRK